MEEGDREGQEGYSPMGTEVTSGDSFIRTGFPEDATLTLGSEELKDEQELV